MYSGVVKGVDRGGFKHGLWALGLVGLVGWICWIRFWLIIIIKGPFGNFNFHKDLFVNSENLRGCDCNIPKVTIRTKNCHILFTQGKKM